MTRVHGVLTDRCTVRDLVPTSPEAVDAAVVELRVAAAGFAQAAAVFGGTAGLPSWVGPAASAFDASAGSVSVAYHQLAVHLPVVAQALADYAVAVRRARDAAWWAVEGMEQAALLSRAWSGSAPVPSGFTQRRPSLVVAPATPDPGEPVRAQVRARWFFAECELFDAGGRAARVLHLEGDMVAREGRSSGPVRFTAGLGGSLLRSGEAIGGQLQVVLPWQAWDVVSGDAKGLYTAARHPVATGKAVLHWDEWRSDPAGAAGGVAGDLVALVLLKGAGDAAGAAADARAVTAAGRTAEVAAGLSFAARVLDDAALARAFVLARTGAASAALGTAVTEKVLGGVAAAREATARLWAEWRAGEEGSLSLPGGRAPEPSVLDRVLKTSGTLPLVDEYVRGPNLTPFSPLRGKYEPAATAVGTDVLATADDLKRGVVNLDDLEASAVSGFGHTLSRHVGKSMEWLQQRVWANRIPVASSFYSKELAEKVIGALTSARAREIDAWLAGSSPRLDLTADLADLGFVDPEALGIVMRGVFIGPGVVVVPRTVAVYLYRDTRGRVGIATATLGA